MCTALCLCNWRSGEHIYFFGRGIVFGRRGGGCPEGIFTDDFSFRVCRSVKRIFSGARFYGSDFFFPDCRADIKCSNQRFGGSYADRYGGRKKPYDTGRLRSGGKCVRNWLRCGCGVAVYAVCICVESENAVQSDRKR